MNLGQNVNKPLATLVEPCVPRQRVGRVGGESWVAAAQQILNFLCYFFTNIIFFTYHYFFTNIIIFFTNIIIFSQISLNQNLQYLLPPPFCWHLPLLLVHLASPESKSLESTFLLSNSVKAADHQIGCLHSVIGITTMIKDQQHQECEKATTTSTTTTT